MMIIYQPKLRWMVYHFCAPNCYHLQLSAENFKLKENLTKERHDYEFSRKDMVREMEQQKQIQSSAQDTAQAKLEVIDEEVNTRALQLMQRTLRTVRAGSVSEDLMRKET